MIFGTILSLVTTVALVYGCCCLRKPSSNPTIELTDDQKFNAMTYKQKEQTFKDALELIEKRLKF